MAVPPSQPLARRPAQCFLSTSLPLSLPPTLSLSSQLSNSGSSYRFEIAAAVTRSTAGSHVAYGHLLGDLLLLFVSYAPCDVTPAVQFLPVI